MTIVEFSRLFKIQWPLSPSRDTFGQRDKHEWQKFRGAWRCSYVLLSAARIINSIIFCLKVTQLEPIASTLLSHFSQKDVNDENEKNLSWLFFFVIISLFVCWSTFKAGYRDPQVRFLDIPKCLFMVAVKGGWKGRGLWWHCNAVHWISKCPPCLL